MKSNYTIERQLDEQDFPLGSEQLRGELEALKLLGDYDNNKIVLFDLNANETKWDWRVNLSAILECHEPASEYDLQVIGTAYELNNLLDRAQD